MEILTLLTTDNNFTTWLQNLGLAAEDAVDVCVHTILYSCQSSTFIACSATTSAYINSKYYK